MKRESYKRRTKSMTEGMTRKNPPEKDASMEPKGGHVDDNACREGVAKTPRTLSTGRTA